MKYSVLFILFWSLSPKRIWYKKRRHISKLTWKFTWSLAYPTFHHTGSTKCTIPSRSNNSGIMTPTDASMAQRACRISKLQGSHENNIHFSNTTAMLEEKIIFVTANIPLSNPCKVSDVAKHYFLINLERHNCMFNNIPINESVREDDFTNVSNQ